MKRECLFKNYLNRFTVYSLCIIVTFISFLALSPNVLAQGTYNPTLYDDDVIPYYPDWGWAGPFTAMPLWDAFLPRMDYQYSIMDSIMDQYSDQLTLQGLIADPGMSTAQYTYSHMSGAGLQNTYTQNLYTNPAVSALPARSRNILFEFWMNTGGQSNLPGSGSGSQVWFPNYPGSGNPSPKPRPPFPVPTIWPTFALSPIMPDIWTGVMWTTMGASPSVHSPDLWSSQGYSQGSMSSMPYLTPSIWSPLGGY